ncbi:MAG: hypothetical protein ACREIO_05135 [Nitrospiraceae bacterium]
MFQMNVLTRFWRSLVRILFLVAVFQLASLGAAPAVFPFDWVPSQEEIQKYRESWNPLSHGPMLISSPDIQPKGQWYIRPMIFAQIGESSFGNEFRLATDANRGPLHLYSIQSPFIQSAYGITDHLEMVGQTSIGGFWARQNGKETNDFGLGDSSIIFKYRPIVQDPDSWVPSLNWFNQVSLPTGNWAGTEKAPGGFSPIGRFPSTRSGEVSLTSGIAFRKNLRPYRWSGGVYYTYSTPGLKNSQGEATYFGDLVNTRLIFEHILSDKHGFGYNLEFVTLHGLTQRIDGHSINAGQKSGFSVLGVEPSIQYRIGDTNFLVAGGVLFTLAGQNATNSFYPNFSVFYYWSKAGKVIMR